MEPELTLQIPNEEHHECRLVVADYVWKGDIRDSMDQVDHT